MRTIFREKIPKSIISNLEPGSGAGSGAGLEDPQEGRGQKTKDNPSTFQGEDHTGIISILIIYKRCFIIEKI